MDELNVDVLRRIFCAVGRGFFSFGPECPMDPEIAAFRVTMYVPPARPFASLARELPNDELWHVYKESTENADFFFRLRLALRDIVALARTCQYLRQQLVVFAKSILLHARLAAPFFDWKRRDRLLARLNNPVDGDAAWACVAAIGWLTPNDVLAGKPIGPNRRIARGNRASALYLIKSGGRVRAVCGSALKPHQQPIFKVGFRGHRLSTQEILGRYQRRRVLEEQLKADARETRKRKREEEDDAGREMKKSRLES